MISVKGKLEEEYGTEVVFNLKDNKSITSFILVTEEKRYPVFFDGKIILPYSSTVEVKGELSTSTVAKALAEEAKPSTLREQIIQETLRSMMEMARTVRKEEAQLTGPYIVATEIHDFQQKIRYVIKK